MQTQCLISVDRYRSADEPTCPEGSVPNLLSQQRYHGASVVVIVKWRVMRYL
jgi:hypothetical protein